MNFFVEMIMTPKVNLDMIEERNGNCGFLYNLMHGSSPYFPTVRSLVKYYNDLPREKKQKHISVVDGKRCIVVYQHVVAMTKFEYYKGWMTFEGEILSTDEYNFIDLQ